ncbi:uncharacterized protein LOC110973663 [Acanthaster planci]|uniref:Uncharacterized protein LOC110973663 n=1 Tax=Acanthaster planci TaxID=133434 RepID=A0A8B7XJM9_ACAPL|nr:uncharacterized protein LOC110973663 [Acanthaster planci]
MNHLRVEERRPALAPEATRIIPPKNSFRMVEMTASVLSAELNNAHMERKTLEEALIEENEEAEEASGNGKQGGGILTPTQNKSGSLTRSTPAINRAGPTRERDKQILGGKQTPPLPSIPRSISRLSPVRSHPGSGVNEFPDSSLPAGPSLETKRAWKMQALERLATAGKKKPTAVLERSDSDVSSSSVFSLEDLKRRITERAKIAVVMVQRRARDNFSLQRQIHEKRNSVPPGPPDVYRGRRSRSRSLTPNRSAGDLVSQRRSSGSSDPLSLKTDRQHSGELIGRLDRSVSTSKSVGSLDSALPEKVTEDGAQPPASMPAGVELYERRRSVAASLLDVNGNLSYASRKSLRRGSYDGRLVEKTPRPARASDSSKGSQASAVAGDGKRPSLTPVAVSRQRGSAEVATLDSGDGFGAQLSRRRRSRAPASLAEDVSRFASKQTNPISCLKRFRLVAKVVVLCVSMCRKSFLRSEKEKEAYMSFESSSSFLGGQRLMFDPAYFKADRQQRLSEETKRILNLRPEARTDDLIKYVEIALRNIRAFAQYPKRMQHMLCRVGWLEEYESKRAILRQGHLPHAFYFILSGEVVVTVLDTKKGKRVAETVAMLKRGDSFGELAILNRTRRASTVISQDRVELLCISVEDFEDIFMLSGGIKRVNDPDQHAFLTSLACLKHWPLHLIEKHPNECRFHFFKDGNVLIKDSLFSDWIYIIKSGSCSVLKKLKRVSPSIPSRLKRKPSAVVWGNSTGHDALPSTAACTTEFVNSSPSKKKQRRHRRNHTWPVITRRPGGIRDGPTQTAADDAGLRSQPAGRASRGMADGFARRSLQGNCKRGVYLKTSRDESGVAASPNAGNKSHGTEQKSDDKNLEEESRPFVQRRREFHSDLDNSRTPVERTEADSDPMFVVVQVLTKGAVFGLTGVVFSDQPSLSLVSNGAECIVINKKFYLEHATEETLRGLRREEVPYPSEEELQSKLQQYMNWNAYRHHTFYTTLYESRDHKTERVTIMKPVLFR